MNLEELLKTAVDDGVRSVPPGYADGALHYEDTSAPFDLPFAELSVDRVDGGFVALVVPPGDSVDEVLYLVPDGGAPTEVDRGALSEVVVSPDRTEFAYAAEAPGTDGLPPGAAMRVADARTGGRLHENASFLRTARPQHYSGADEIVVESSLEAVLLHATWRPGDEPAPWSQTAVGDGGRSELSPAHDHLVTPNGPRHSVGPFGDDQIDANGWSLEPTQGHPRFSPDGRYLVSVGILPTDETTSVTIRDARTGAVVDRFVRPDATVPAANAC